MGNSKIKYSSLISELAKTENGSEQIMELQELCSEYITGCVLKKSINSKSRLDAIASESEIKYDQKRMLKLEEAVKKCNLTDKVSIDEFAVEFLGELYKHKDKY